MTSDYYPVEIAYFIPLITLFNIVVMLFKKWILFPLVSLFVILAATASMAEGEFPDMNIDIEKAENVHFAIVDFGVSVIEAIVGAMAKVLFFPIAGFPLLVAWLVIGGVFFTFRLGFINIKLFHPMPAGS